MLKWLSANKDGLSIMIAVVTALSGAAWGASTAASSMHTGTISTGGGTIDKSTTIITDSKVTASLAESLTTALALNAKQSNKIENLQEQLQASKRSSPTVSKEAIEIANKISDETKNIYALALKAIALGYYDRARQHLTTLIKQQKSQYALQRDNLAKFYRARIETEYYDGKFNKALVWAEKLVGLGAKNTMAYYNRGIAYKALKNYPKALSDYQMAYQLDSNNRAYINSLVWLYSTSKLASLRNPSKAVALTNNGLLASNNPFYLDTASAAYAENNNFDRAVSLSKKALVLANASNESATTVTEIERHLALFRKKMPIRE